MLQILSDESENQCLKMNESKIKVKTETDTPIHVKNTQIENVESYMYLGQRYSTREQTKTRRFKEESQPDWMHSLSTLTYSRVILEHA